MLCVQWEYHKVLWNCGKPRFLKGQVIRTVILFLKRTYPGYPEFNRPYYNYYYFKFKFRIDRIREES